VTPAIDAHAHLVPNLTLAEVDGLRDAFVMGVTRSPAEWGSALRRRDRRIAWGLGCHPADPSAMAEFSEARIAAVASRAAFFGEVGLDARSRVPADAQEQVLRWVLRVAAAEGIAVSIHSTGRSSRVLDLLDETGAASAILHWWGGSDGETERAVALGCYFSVNAAMRDEALALLPRMRVVTETDFPATRSRDRSVDRPGAVGSIEARLAALWSVSPADVRNAGWSVIREIDAGAGRLAQTTQSASVSGAKGRPGLASET
jgi:TatD DNase family protein